MAILFPMKLVNIGNVNLGGINSVSWGTNVQMFANSGEIGILTDWKNQCKCCLLYTSDAADDM
eukprot:2319667-Karenia_brevis.AAC.1